MDVDTALAEVPVNILPLVDSTDFVTIEDAIAYNASGMDLRWNFVTTGGAYTSTAVTPTTAGNYDWAHQGDGMYSIEIPASGGASINNDTEGFGWFSGKVTGVLPFRGPVIGFRAAGLNDLLIDNAYSTTRGLAGTALPAVAAEAAGGLYTRGTGAGQINQAANGMIDTNPVRLNNVSQSLLDLKDFADDGYDPSTNKVQGVVLTDTVTTYTGNTPQTGDSFARIGAAGAGLTALPWNAAWDAEVQSEVDDALIAKGLDHLVFTSVAGADVADNSIVAKLVSKSVTADWDTFNNVTDSLEGARDHATTITNDISSMNSTVSTIDSNTQQVRLRFDGLVGAYDTVGDTGNDTTHVHLSALTFGDDEINGFWIAIRDESTDEVHFRQILDWVNSTKLATVSTLPFTPTDLDGDTYFLISPRLDAAGVRLAVGLASANLDTQLADIPTVAEFEARTLTATAATRLGLMFSSARLITVDDATFTPTTTAFETDQTTDESAVYSEQVLFALDGGNVGMTVRITAYAFTNSKVKLTVDALKVAPSDGHRFLMMGRIEQG